MFQSTGQWRRQIAWLLIWGMVLCQGTAAWALITGGFGNEPHPDRNWPMGTLAVTNLETRLGWWEGPPFGGGEYHFLYRGNAKSVNEALVALSKIDAPEVRVEIHSGPHQSFWLKLPDRRAADDPKKAAPDSRIDWDFVVWIPENYHRLFNHPQGLVMADQPNFRQPIPAPTLNIYVGGGLIEWKDVTIPKNVRVIDHRAGGQPADKTAKVTGKVYNTVTSKPVAQATVSIMKHGGQKPEAILNAVTDDHGQFSLSGIPTPGGYNIWIEAEGLAARDLGFREYEAGTTQNSVVYLSPLESVQGKIINELDQPLANAQVVPLTMFGIDGKGYTMPVRPEVKSDAGGRFTLQLPKGFVYLSCRSEKRHQRDFLKLLETSTKDLLIEMEGTTQVTIRLINDNDQPLANKVVSLEPSRDPRGKWGGMSNTDEKGRVIFEGVPPGEYLIRPDGPNGKHTKKVTIPGDNKPVEISFTTK